MPGIYKYLSIALVLMLSACTKQTRADYNYVDELRSVNKLVLAQMTVSKMATIDDLPLDDARGIKQTAAAMLDIIKIGNRKAAYSYDTYLRAYVDMSQLSPDDVRIDHDARTVSITLPPIETEFEGRDITVKEDHYRVTGLRSNIDQYERAEMKEMMNTSLKNEVESNPEFRRRLIREAQAKARAYFEALADNEGYTVIVDFKPGKGDRL